MPWAGDEGARRSVPGNRPKDIAPKVAARWQLRTAGSRYRVDFAPIGGRRREDTVFRRPKDTVFIDGCFWPTTGAWAVSQLAGVLSGLGSTKIRRRSPSHRRHLSPRSGLSTEAPSSSCRAQAEVHRS
ncbi:PDDEXK family nuclease [Microbacterium gorillae]|uniref:hypothetical protein n=1 Tax=Microbacterium gorillae TaxID=1231063 RepID=UPI0038991F05